MKNLRLKKAFALGSVLIMAAIFFSFSESSLLSADEWVVPAKYLSMKNPVSPDSESIAIGKELYSKHCKSCHGKDGEGDGTKAEELEDFPGDFTEAEFTKQKDGALFYKTFAGRDEMPAFDKKIPDEEDIWHVVNYMRTFAK